MPPDCLHLKQPPGPPMAALTVTPCPPEKKCSTQESVQWLTPLSTHLTITKSRGGGHLEGHRARVVSALCCLAHLNIGSIEIPERSKCSRQPLSAVTNPQGLQMARGDARLLAETLETIRDRSAEVSPTCSVSDRAGRMDKCRMPETEGYLHCMPGDRDAGQGGFCSQKQTRSVMCNT